MATSTGVQQFATLALGVNILFGGQSALLSLLA